MDLRDVAARFDTYVVDRLSASLTMAAIYFLIGLGIADIGGSSTGEMVDLAMFGASAGSVFLLLGVLLLLTDRRWLWVLAAIFQVFVFATYFGASSGRVPPFEMWGITLRIVQIVLFVSLVYLSVRAPTRDTSTTA